MTAKKSGRVAVLGTYRSGSTALAGVMHHLGVDMGAPFYEEFYEPEDLSRQLRKWWNEPELKPMVSASKRVARLKRWIKKREAKHKSKTPVLIGAKHPLLGLCGDEIVQAWGSSTRFIWSYRSLDKSISSLKHLGWWKGKEEFIQNMIYSSCDTFFKNRENLTINYDAMVENPEREIYRIMDYLELEPSDQNIKIAVASVIKKA